MLEVSGPVMSKALSHFARHFISPTFMREWFPNTKQVATCSIGCDDIPSDTHDGCGFHGLWDISESKRYIHNLFGTSSCIVLVEITGKIKAGSLGARAKEARVIAVIDYDPLPVIFPKAKNYPPENVPTLAKKHFKVPMLTSEDGQDLIVIQNTANGINMIYNGMWYANA